MYYAINPIVKQFFSAPMTLAGKRDLRQQSFGTHVRSQGHKLAMLEVFALRRRESQELEHSDDGVLSLGRSTLRLWLCLSSAAMLKRSPNV